MNPESPAFTHNQAESLAQFEIEAPHKVDVLPTRDQLIELYNLEMSLQDTPPIRLAKPGENHNTIVTTYDQDTPEEVLADTERIRDAYIFANRPSAWWFGVQNSLGHNTLDGASDLKVAAKHTVNIEANGEKQPDQFLEVYEMGDKRVDEESLKTVFETLGLIDQFSGGLISADPNRPKIIIGSNMRLRRNNGGEELKGYVSEGFTFINLDAIAERAEQAGVDYQEMVAVVTIHEILGHNLEKLVYSKTGKYFEEHFDYSEDKVPGEHFDSVHSSITPKDISKSESKPVREYGSVNPAEDLATVVDASMSQALGLNKGINKVAILSSQEDDYRKSLVMELMDKAAQQAKQYQNTPGFVGSEITYTTDQNGELKVKPVRELSIKSISGEEAVQEEIHKIISQKKFPTELIVKTEEFTGI